MRYAIWAAVSTAEQARKNHYSIPVQLERCTEVGTARGWELVETYIADGHSRTKYVDLSTAEKEIKRLGAMIADAKAGKFDIVLMINFNRLRDLRPMVAHVLNSYKVQMISLTQWTEPKEPGEFKTYDQGAIIMQSVSDLTSQIEIATLRQHHAEKMPQRILISGLAPSAPYGYTYAGRKEPHVQIALECEALIKAKDLALEGVSLRQIAERLTADGYPPPLGNVWYPQTIRRMLINPYYAGVVSYRKTLRQYDPHNPQFSTVILTPERAIKARGVHDALWDEATLAALVAALKEEKPYFQSVTPLSRLARCSYCDNALSPNRDKLHNRLTLRCGTRGDGRDKHTVIEYGEALDRLTVAIQASIMAADLSPASSLTDDSVMLELSARRERLVDALEQGALDARTYHERVTKLDAEIEAEKAKLDYAELENVNNAQRAATLTYLREHVDTIPQWLQNDEPRRVNRVLRTLYSKIVFSRDGIELVYR